MSVGGYQEIRESWCEKLEDDKTGEESDGTVYYEPRVERVGIASYFVVCFHHWLILPIQNDAKSWKMIEILTHGY